MKTTLKATITTFLLSTMAFATVTVDGNAYLENQSDHSGITITFERTIPSALTETATTDASGYFTAELETGIYDVTYTKDNYFSSTLTGQSLWSSTTLSDITLIEHTTLINVPALFSTIQGAIDHAVNGDTVLVQPGTYVENINYNGKNIVVGSLILTTNDTSYISSTIIDGNAAGSVVIFENGESSTAVLTGFTIQNGNANYGGGISCWYDSSPSLENVTITNNSASDDGGGIYCYDNSSPSLENVTLSNNSASTGGGIYCDWNSSPSLANVTLSNNSASTGGGMYCYNLSNPTLSNVTITGNSASYGGGIHCESSSPSLVDVTITDNSASYGGGILCADYSSPSLANVTITGNSASTGGGIYCYSSSPSLVDVTLSNNSASSYGGGIYCWESSPSLVDVTISDNSASYYGGGIYCRVNSSPSLVDVTITNNTASYGGGMYCSSSSPSLENVTITDNSASYYGGGMYCDNSSPSLENVTISNNSASDYGGGVYCRNNSSPSLENATITNNSASSYGGGIFCDDSSPNLLNTIVSGNEGNYGIYVASGDPSIAYSNFYNNENGNFYNAGEWVGVNVTTNANGDSCDAYMNIQMDPLFVDATNGDYNLQQGSPCIDAGDPTSPYDPDGSIADMGAFPSPYGTEIIYGCTDPTAANYDPNATIDDGSCLSYPAIIPEGVIVINEIHYNSSSDQGDDDLFEFLELFNTSDADVDLSFALFTEGIDHVFEYGTTISAGGYLVLAKDSSSYSGSIEWEGGSLGNGGEEILLANGVDSTTIDFMDYDDGGDWPSSPDGDGPSLELIDPILDNSLPENWQASYVDNGTPGAENSSATPIVSISPDSLNFTITPPDSEQTQTLTISNTGDATLEVNLFVGSPPVTDIDGNVYQTVQIGDQVWMAENLKVAHYRDGTSIPTGHSNSEWSSLSTGAYAVYNDDVTNADTYGYLYNWYAATDSRNIAPEGWHVPTDDEIKQLEMHLGMSQSEADGIGWRGTDEGSKLAGNADLWDDGNLENNAEFGTSGFTVLPGGYRYSGNGNYNDMGSNGFFWSSTEINSDIAWSRLLSFYYSGVYRISNFFTKQSGFSVRCVRDLDNLTIRQFDNLDESKNETHLENYAHSIANTQSRSSRTDWLIISTDSLTIQPGASADVTVTVNAGGLGSGIYSENISITSNDTENSLIVVPVNMSVANSAPFVFQPINDVTVDEDADTLSLLIDGVFDDADIINGDTLTITAVSLNTDLITIGSDSNEVPYMVFVPDANGETDVVVTATDLAGLSVNDTVHVTVNAVNDSPNEFNLTETDEVIAITLDELSTGSLDFEWEVAEDVDGDSIVYHYTSTLTAGSYTEQLDSSLVDTSLTLMTYRAIYDKLFAWEVTTAVLEWHVYSDDGTVSVPALNGPLTLSIDISSLSVDDQLIPDVFALHQNYPNPFNPTTTLQYDLPEDAQVRIMVYDLMGREVRSLVNNQQNAGFKSVVWDGTNESGQPVSAGMYLYRISAGDFRQTKKMVLLK